MANRNGGGGYFKSDATFINTDFMSNTAYMDGGGIYQQSGGRLKTSGGMFQNNTAHNQHGGAVFATALNITSLTTLHHKATVSISKTLTLPITVLLMPYLLEGAGYFG